METENTGLYIWMAPGNLFCEVLLNAVEDPASLPMQYLTIRSILRRLIPLSHKAQATI